MLPTEGKIAGYTAAGRTELAKPLLKQRDRQRQLHLHLTVLFFVGPELKELAKADTIVCRCEDVTYGRLKQENRGERPSCILVAWAMRRRICGPATEFLFNWKTESTRPPISPVRCESFLAMSTLGTRTQRNIRRQSMIWNGVMPAITTCFDGNYAGIRL
jgi:hypothetical protein